MYSISREFSFSMGHRLNSHQGLCKNFHGHNYKVIISLKSERLNSNGMVMDFGDLKAIATYHFKNIDHAMLIHKSDAKKFMKLQREMPFLKVVVVDYESTAENMAYAMFKYFEAELLTYNNDIKVNFVTVYETNTSQATYSED